MEEKKKERSRGALWAAGVGQAGLIDKGAPEGPTAVAPHPT